MSNTTVYQSENQAHLAPFVPNLPASNKMSEGKETFVSAPKLRPLPRPLTPRTHQNYPPATTPIPAGGSFNSNITTSDISLYDAIMALYRDLPRAVDIAERRTPHLDGAEKTKLSQYRETLTTPYMLSLLMLVQHAGLKSFTLSAPLLDNPVFRVAQIAQAMIEGLQSRGHVGISIASVYNASEDADDVQRRIMAQLAHMLREMNNVKNESSDFRSLLPS